MPCPRRTALALTAQLARSSPWWTCSRPTSARARTSSIAAASATAASGSAPSGSTIARTQRPGRAVATNASASPRVSSPASIPTPRASRCSQSATIPASPWLAVTRSGSSVQAATRARRRSGSGSISAEVLSDTGTPGHVARTARSASAHGAAASVSAPSS